MTTAQTEARAIGDPYMRIVDFFDRDETAGSFLREDGEGGFVGGIYRMAREIESLRASSAAKDAEIAALKKEAADVVRPFAEVPLEGTFGGPLCGAKGLYEDGSEPEYNPDRSILGREPFCAARSFLDTLERRDG